MQCNDANAVVVFGVQFAYSLISRTAASPRLTTAIRLNIVTATVLDEILRHVRCDMSRPCPTYPDYLVRELRRDALCFPRLRVGK
ncbi:hypothetical protein N806_10075 [Rhodococcus sp. P27]|nr:hypothetical protein N806_10075 [Rhodococcus sp. P27]